MIETSKNFLLNTLRENDFNTTTSIVGRTLEKIYIKTKNRQINKFERLVKKTERPKKANVNPNTVINLSNHQQLPEKKKFQALVSISLLLQNLFQKKQ